MKGLLTFAAGAVVGAALLTAAACLLDEVSSELLNEDDMGCECCGAAGPEPAPDASAAAAAGSVAVPFSDANIDAMILSGDAVAGGVAAPLSDADIATTILSGDAAVAFVAQTDKRAE